MKWTEFCNIQMYHYWPNIQYYNCRRNNLEGRIQQGAQDNSQKIMNISVKLRISRQISISLEQFKSYKCFKTCWASHISSLEAVVLNNRPFKVCIWIGNVVFLVSLGGVRLSPLGTSATVGLLYQPRMIDDADYGAVGGMRIGRWNQSTRRKPAPMPLCPPQIPHDLACDRTRAAAVGSQRLTAWAMARPIGKVNSHRFITTQCITSWTLFHVIITDQIPVNK
jgi:hypothetical protein